MRKHLIAIAVLLSIISLVAYADWTTTQKSYFAGTWGEWADLATLTNVHGQLLHDADSDQLNWTMGYSTASGKWYHFIVGSASMDAAASTNPVLTRPMSADGFSSVSVQTYLSSVAVGTSIQDGSFTYSGDDGPTFTVDGSAVPSTIIDGATPTLWAASPLVASTSNVAAGDTAVSSLGVHTFNLNGVKSVQLKIYDAALGAATAGFFVSFGN